MYIQKISKKYKVSYILSLMLLIFSSLVQAANITVQADRSPIVLGEQFTLTFSADANPSGDPDFSPLTKDFDILRQGKSSSVRMINGDVTQNISWNISLFPKKAGNITIPAIQFGSEQSPSIELIVASTPPAQQGGQVSQDIIVEAELSAKSVYVQQQLVYTQRLYFARDFFRNATLTTPQPKAGKMDIEKLGSDREYTEMKNGRQYKVTERRYAIFPIQSGKIEIAPTFFEGRLIERGSQQQNFGFFSRPTGQLVRRYSPAFTVEVKPQATAFNGKHWLPATNLTLHANWSIPPEKAKTGEPITLTIGIIANGLRAEQLPQVTVDMPTGLKAYHDQAVLHNDSNSQEIIGTRQEKVVVVAANAGEFKIPEIRVSWWDTKTESQKTATIPAKTLKATGTSTVTPATQPIQTPAQQTAPAPQPVMGSTQKTVSKVATSTGNSVTNLDATSSKQTKGETVWFYISMLLFALLIFVLYLLWRQPKMSRELGKATDRKSHQLSAVDALKLVEQACESQDNKQLRDAIIVWGQAYLQLPNSNLQNIADEVTDTSLSLEIKQLMKALYASERSNWHCAKLCDLLLDYRIKKIQAKSTSRISSLYPEE